MSKILITGGNGFIGSHIVETFLKKDHEITCIVRKSSDLKNLKNLEVKIVYGDVSDKGSIFSYFEDVDFVVHNASLVKDWGEWENFYNTNVQGTLNVLELCKENDILDILMTGTISSYGEEDCHIVKNEKSPFDSHYDYFMGKIFPCKMNFYRDSKRIAVEKASEFADDNELNLTIIEPVWVYGEREFSSGFYEYLKSVEDGMKSMPGSKRNKFHVVYVKDLAFSYHLAFEKKFKGINRFIIGNEKSDNMNDLYEKFCNEAGLKMPGKIPKFLIYPIAFFMELYATITKSKEAPLLTRGRVNMFYDNIEYSIEKSQKMLGFQPEVTLDDGIKRTVKWYKDNGYLK